MEEDIKKVEESIKLLQKARPNIQGLGMPINQLKRIVEDYYESINSICQHPEDSIYYCLNTGGGRCRKCKKVLNGKSINSPEGVIK